MQHRQPAQGVGHFIVSPFIYFDEAFDTRPSRTTGQKPNRGLAQTIIGAVRALWEREPEQRELTAMRAGDLHGPNAPSGPVAEELRRWPWQRQNPLSASLGSAKKSGYQIVVRPSSVRPRD